jgi:hypothetical protein
MERSAKHLFRHLHDVSALRKNPIARSYCQMGLQHLHAAVRTAAEQCRDDELRDGHDERAARQYSIVALHCLERRALREVASRLGVSVRQCYRDRAEICGRIAAILSRREAGISEMVPRVDEFQHALINAFRRAALGDTHRALRDCDGLARNAGLLARKLQAVRAGISILTDSGAVDRAPSALRHAEWLWAAAPANERQSPVSQAAMALLRWQLAYLSAESATALEQSETAVRLLRSSSMPRSAIARDMLLEGLYACGTARCNAGDMQGGYDSFVTAESEIGDDYSVLFTTRARLKVTTWKLRCSLLTSATAWRPLFERTKGLTDAFNEAYGTGDFAAAITALDAMTQQYVTAGNDDEAFRAANLALVIAEQQSSERVKSQLAIRLALKLLPTPYAYQAAALAARAKAKACDGYHRQLISYFRLEHALSTRKYAEAFRLANEESDGKEYAALTVHRNLVKASAAQALGRRHLARVTIEAAVPAAERLSSAHTLIDAYRVAAKITGESRFRRQARDIARLFAG